jgi:CheY-like chemotaxis protein
MDHITSSCAHIQQILDNSLDLCKLEQHKLVLSDEPVRLALIAQKIQSMLRMRCNPGVSLEVDCPDISFRGDNTRWTQLLLNLVHNSTKFTQSGKVSLDITVGPVLDDPQDLNRVLNVMVSDTGCGITPRDQASLFMKYQQVHEQGTRTSAASGTGTGLGLVICRHIVELMGGEITVTSPLPPSHKAAANAVSAGSLFSFSIQLDSVDFHEAGCAIEMQEIQEVDGNAEQSAQTTGDLVKMGPVILRVLVVDDELLNRMVLSKKLQQAKEALAYGLFGAVAPNALALHVTDAEHAEQALSHMEARLLEQPGAGSESHTVDIVLLDEHMKSSGGILKGSEAIAHFRKLADQHGHKQPFVVINSGNCTKQDAANYLKMGADAVWPKPYPAGAKMAVDIAEWVRSRIGETAHAAAGEVRTASGSAVAELV